jgi:hypothetical protein
MWTARRRVDRVCVFAIALAGAVVVVVISGCTTPTNPGPGGPTDGRADTRADARGVGGDASADGDAALLACSATPRGCLCSEGTPTSDGPAACSAASVAVNAGEQGLCCTSGALCRCSAYACENNATTEYCDCGLAVDVHTKVMGSIVAACPTPTATQKCCLTTTTDGSECSCLAADCDASATQVASCALTDVALCQAGEQVVGACK